jgi:hypothetical protein
MCLTVSDAARGKALRLRELVWFRRDVMTLEEYFSQADAPGTESPVGTLIVRIIEKNPGISFEATRAEANNLLRQAAGRCHYRVSSVLSPSEKVEAETRTKMRFNSVRNAP